MQVVGGGVVCMVPGVTVGVIAVVRWEYTVVKAAMLAVSETTLAVSLALLSMSEARVECLVVMAMAIELR